MVLTNSSQHIVTLAVGASLQSLWAVGLVSFTEGVHVDPPVPQQVHEAVRGGRGQLGLAGQNPGGFDVCEPQQTAAGIDQGVVVVVRLDHPVGAVRRGYQ